jgi:hypothetical protein
VRCEESTLRKTNEGWVQSGVQKVKCKGKVQKGKCRVSADRQVQTRNPLRTQTRSVVATTCGLSKCLRQNSARGRREWFSKDGSSTNYMRCIRDDSMITPPISSFIVGWCGVWVLPTPFTNYMLCVRILINSMIYLFPTLVAV